LCGHVFILFRHCEPVGRSNLNCNEEIASSHRTLLAMT
jgi:hypothetical protein